MLGTPLYTLFRGAYPEVEIHGEIAFFDGVSAFRVGNGLGRYPARSVLKPFQFLATGLAEALPTERLVPCLGSISATRAQVEALRGWHGNERLLWLRQRLKLPPAYPMDESHRAELKDLGTPPDVLFHTCFSKHAAILQACERRGWDCAGYETTQHPFHGELERTMERILGRKFPELPAVPDGCGLPSPVLRLEDLAELFQRLASAPSGTEMGRVATAMRGSPEWIGGPGRTDTQLMAENPGRVIAKEGADGLLAVGIAPGPGCPAGMGIIAKVAAGFLAPQAALALRPWLEALGLEPVGEAPRGQTVAYRHAPFARGPALRDLSPTLSPRIAIWPGDVPFRRRVSVSTDSGSHLTLSSIETTVHVGTHTDATNHFEGRSRGIDAVDPSAYVGPCQVVTVRVGMGGVARPEHLAATPIVAPRVILRTGSFPDPERFDESFVALSAELVHWLADRGVTLVGIDTPSVDPFSSKDLPAHHATMERGVRILEGVVLGDLADGLYDLMAVPLKIEGADASPVRVLLS